MKYEFKFEEKITFRFWFFWEKLIVVKLGRETRFESLNDQN